MVLGRIPIGRRGEPEDFIDAVLFLSSKVSDLDDRLDHVHRWRLYNKIRSMLIRCSRRLSSTQEGLWATVYAQVVAGAGSAAAWWTEKKELTVPEEGDNF